MDALAGFVILREEHLLRRTMSAQPVGPAALEGPQGPAIELAGMRGEQMLEQRLRFNPGALFEPPLRFRPDPGQWIGPRAPRMWLSQVFRTRLRRHIAACRLAVHPRLHRSLPEQAAGLVLLH